MIVKIDNQQCADIHTGYQFAIHVKVENCKFLHQTSSQGYIFGLISWMVGAYLPSATRAIDIVLICIVGRR